MQEQENHISEEKNRSTSLISKITTPRIIFLCLVGCFSVYVPIYLGVYIDWIDVTLGMISFVSSIGLLAFIFRKTLNKYPTITSLTFSIFLFFFFLTFSFLAPSKNVALPLRIASLGMLVIFLWDFYMSMDEIIAYFKKKFSFMKLSQNIGKIIGFFSVVALLILTIIQIFEAFHK